MIYQQHDNDYQFLWSETLSVERFLTALIREYQPQAAFYLASEPDAPSVETSFKTPRVFCRACALEHFSRQTPLALVPLVSHQASDAESVFLSCLSCQTLLNSNPLLDDTPFNISLFIDLMNELAEQWQQFHSSTAIGIPPLAWKTKFLLSLRGSSDAFLHTQQTLFQAVLPFALKACPESQTEISFRLSLFFNPQLHTLQTPWPYSIEQTLFLIRHLLHRQHRSSLCFSASLPSFSPFRWRHTLINALFFLFYRHTQNIETSEITFDYLFHMKMPVPVHCEACAVKESTLLRLLERYQHRLCLASFHEVQMNLKKAPDPVSFQDLQYYDALAFKELWEFGEMSITVKPCFLVLTIPMKTINPTESLNQNIEEETHCILKIAGTYYRTKRRELTFELGDIQGQDTTPETFSQLLERTKLLLDRMTGLDPHHPRVLYIFRYSFHCHDGFHNDLSLFTVGDSFEMCQQQAFIRFSHLQEEVSTEITIFPYAYQVTQYHDKLVLKNRRNVFFSTHSFFVNGFARVLRGGSLLQNPYLLSQDHLPMPAKYQQQHINLLSTGKVMNSRPLIYENTNSV